MPRTSSPESRVPVVLTVAEPPPDRPSGTCARTHLDDGQQLRFLDVVGRGTFGTVSRALLGPETGIQRLVAVKSFSAMSSDEADRAHLLGAVRRSACIRHPNVVQTYDCASMNGQPLVISELVEGVSLAALNEAYASRHRRMPLDLALFIAVEIAEGLAAAHAARGHDGERLGILHQALSAREVILSWLGEVKISDFELSAACSASSSVRSARSIGRRVSSMAPEVAQGAEADPRADVFSFGVLLRELLVGPRFPAGISNSEAVRLAREGFVEPVTFQPQLPRDLDGVIARALEIDPGARYPSAAALASDLRPVAFAMGVSDGRFFLKKTLEREWEVEDVTGQIAAASANAEEDDDVACYGGLLASRGVVDEADELADTDVVDVER